MLAAATWTAAIAYSSARCATLEFLSLVAGFPAVDRGLGFRLLLVHPVLHVRLGLGRSLLLRLDFLLHLIELLMHRIPDLFGGGLQAALQGLQAVLQIVQLALQRSRAAA